MNGKVPEFQVVEYTQEEYVEDMKKILEEKGLHDSIKEICDKIDVYASCLSYGGHRCIQEYLNDILVLIDLSKGESK